MKFNVGDSVSIKGKVVAVSRKTTKKSYFESHQTDKVEHQADVEIGDSEIVVSLDVDELSKVEPEITP